MSSIIVEYKNIIKQNDIIILKYTNMFYLLQPKLIPHFELLQFMKEAREMHFNSFSYVQAHKS